MVWDAWVYATKVCWGFLQVDCRAPSPYALLLVMAFSNISSARATTGSKPIPAHSKYIGHDGSEAPQAAEGGLVLAAQVKARCHDVSKMTSKIVAGGGKLHVIKSLSESILTMAATTHFTIRLCQGTCCQIGREQTPEPRTTV